MALAKMKSLSVHKLVGSMRRSRSEGDDISAPEGDGPEAIASRSVTQFCNSSGPNSQDDEVLFLPAIVDAAESSPAAAAECARLLRKYLGRDHMSRPSAQYNAFMLVRILADHPGAIFTRNLDKKFADTTRDLIRSTKNDGVRGIICDALNHFERNLALDAGLAPLVEMWAKERERAPRVSNAVLPFIPPPSMQPAQQRTRLPHQLPSSDELATRLAEASTSAKLLTQLVSNTPASELLTSDIVREFGDRCKNALRSVQAYMTVENPAPDNDIMENLIDSNEELQNAINQYQRAVLSARKQMGIGERTPTIPSPASAPVSATALASVPAPQASGAIALQNSAPTLSDSIIQNQRQRKGQPGQLSLQQPQPAEPQSESRPLPAQQQPQQQLPGTRADNGKGKETRLWDSRRLGKPDDETVSATSDENPFGDPQTALTRADTGAGASKLSFETQRFAAVEPYMPSGDFGGGSGQGHGGHEARNTAGLHGPNIYTGHTLQGDREGLEEEDLYGSTPTQAQSDYMLR